MQLCIDIETNRDTDIDICINMDKEVYQKAGKRMKGDEKNKMKKTREKRGEVRKYGRKY